MTSFLEELDKRVLEKQQESKKHVPERKVREIGDNINSCPPAESSKWTIDPACLQGMQVYHVYFVLRMLACFMYYRSSKF